MQAAAAAVGLPDPLAAPAPLPALPSYVEMVSAAERVAASISGVQEGGGSQGAGDEGMELVSVRMVDMQSIKDHARCGGSVNHWTMGNVSAYSLSFRI